MPRLVPQERVSLERAVGGLKDDEGKEACYDEGQEASGPYRLCLIIQEASAYHGESTVPTLMLYN
jgi:hypothetical protein